MKKHFFILQPRETYTGNIKYYYPPVRNKLDDDQSRKISARCREIVQRDNNSTIIFNLAARNVLFDRQTGPRIGSFIRIAAKRLKKQLQINEKIHF